MRFFFYMLFAFYCVYTVNKLINRIGRREKQNDLPRQPINRDNIEDAVYTEIEERKDTSDKK